MDAVHVLLVNLDLKACPEDHCQRLAEQLHSVPSTRPLSVRTITHFPSDTLSPPPDLLLLRSSGTTNLSEEFQRLRRRWHLVPILGLFCTMTDTPTAVCQAMHHGLDDFFSCPFRDIDVVPRLQRWLSDNQPTKPAPYTEEMKAQLHRAGLVGESGPFLQVLQHALQVASSDATVLLTGETGTGKELVARAVHYCNLQQDKPFVPVNCGALPDHLVENELFGHAKGAYTDASSSEQGLVAEAEGGTLFLDEVDTLSASAQVKLLRFLQDRAYRPLGSARSMTANVRVIAATNADLWKQVQAKRFREDLYYRLHVIALHLPPLRERTDDIPRLAMHFLHRYGPQYSREPQQFSVTALYKLMAYPWPGNVRELETVVQRTVLLSASPVLHPDDIELSLPHQPVLSQDTPFQEAKAQVIAQFERTYLLDLLSTHQGNITRAAKQAGKERRAFTRLMQKYDLHQHPFQA